MDRATNHPVLHGSGYGTPVIDDDDEIDSEAVTVRTPNLPPIVGEPLAPIPPPASTHPMTARPRSVLPLSLRAPASKAHESTWFEKEPSSFVAPGVPEVAEPMSGTLARRRGLLGVTSRGVGFAMVALLLAGIVAAGSFFFLSARATADAKRQDEASTTQITNADAPVSPPVAQPEATATPPVPTMLAKELPDSRTDHRPARTAAVLQDQDIPPATTPNGGERPIPTTTASPDSTTTPPDLQERR